MRVLGVDPGLTRCGIGVVDGLGARKVQFVSAGVIRTSTSNPVEQRLLGISQGIEQWLTEFQPDIMAVERVFAQHNLHTVMGTAQAAGLCITAAAQRGIPVAWYTPSEVKAGISGNGNADKRQVQYMVQRLLRLVETPAPADAADALALAITCLWRPGSAVAAASSGFSNLGDQPKPTAATQQWLAAEAEAKRKNPRRW